MNEYDVMVIDRGHAPSEHYIGALAAAFTWSTLAFNKSDFD